MATNIIMPKAGMSMEEGKVIKWLASVGDSVSQGDPLLEIETDKTAMEVEAPASGILLEILAQNGEVVPVTRTIGYIGAAGEQPGADAPQAEKEAPVSAAQREEYDVIVIGGGPAGYVAAIRAAQLGGKVALVEKDTVGGTCLNRGCIPTKTYLKTAEILGHVLDSAQRGIHIDRENVHFNMKEALQNKKEVVQKLTGGVAALLRSNGVNVIRGQGIALSANLVEAGGKQYSTRNIIFAGGSMPGTIGVSGIDSKYVLNSDEMLELEEVPKRLAVIGGGVIGVELGSAFAAFGSQVTVIELMDRIVPNMDEEISVLLKKELERKGIKILNAVRLKEIVETADGVKLVLDDGSAVEADRALLSIGRVPDCAGIARLGVELNRGKVVVNERMETSVPHVYAPGDVNGRCMLAHAAFKMGEVAAENAMGGNAVYAPRQVPASIYTTPEVGAIGLTEAEARRSHDVKIGKFPFAANGRALASGEGAGFVKIISEKKYGEILGVHIIGPGAAEMVNEASLLMSMEVTDEEMARIIHAHPTYSEAMMEAAADAAGKCIHLPKK